MSCDLWRHLQLDKRQKNLNSEREWRHRAWKLGIGKIESIEIEFDRR